TRTRTGPTAVSGYTTRCSMCPTRTCTRWSNSTPGGCSIFPAEPPVEATAHISRRIEMTEPIEQLPQDDWVDQDLLTRSLAGELLDEEIEAERERIARMDRGETGEDLVMS